MFMQLIMEPLLILLGKLLEPQQGLQRALKAQPSRLLIGAKLLQIQVQLEQLVSIQPGVKLEL